MITSSSNQQMKNITALMKKAKERKSQNLFVVEGRKMFEEVPPEWLSKVYVSERFLEEPEAEQLLAGKTYEVVADAVFKSISDTQTPQGILCLVRMPQYPLSDLLRGNRTHLLIVESIQDPGNLGTMLRTGEGAGITGIIMNRTTVDLFNPKTTFETVPCVDHVLVYDGQKHEVTAFFVNRMEESAEATVSLQGMEPEAVLKSIALFHEDKKATNQKEHDCVTPVELENASCSGNEISVELVPLSFQMVQIRLK